MWAGIHGDGLELELMCLSTCEMRTRGEGTGRGGPHHTRIRLPTDTIWHFMTVWYTSTHSLYSLHSLLSFFFLTSVETYLKQTWHPHNSASPLYSDYIVKKGGHEWGEHTQEKKNLPQPIPLERDFPSATKRHRSVTTVSFTVTWLMCPHLFSVLYLQWSTLYCVVSLCYAFSIAIVNNGYIWCLHVKFYINKVSLIIT